MQGHSRFFVLSSKAQGIGDFMVCLDCSLIPNYIFPKIQVLSKLSPNMFGE